MEIYLDANATTSVLPQAREAALNAMLEGFGNPSSIHSAGLRARVILDETRACARRVLRAASGRLMFTSGATEGIQTAVLSALTALSERRAAGEVIPTRVLYGATEHKAVPEAIRHWNRILRLDLDIQSIPVGMDGRHDLTWLREHAPQAGLVCTMAANNETGVVSDLSAISSILAGGPALWLVDGVQALGKLDLQLEQRRIDYSPFSGHKLYAPKGIGMLYVRDGAPFTPLIAGGGQESALRSGTENMTGIAALGAVLSALESGHTFCSAQQLTAHRQQLLAALTQAFPGLTLNAPLEGSLPTTLNFSVPGVSSRLLLDLFDAAGIRVSGGSACGASKAQPSYVLEAMGLPAWRTASAVRMSFGAADSTELIEQACARIQACGESLREAGQLPADRDDLPTCPADSHLELLTRFIVDDACCYVVADASTRRCVVIDPLPALTDTLAQWLRGRRCSLVAVLHTHGHGDHASAAAELRSAAGVMTEETHDTREALDSLGWPQALPMLTFGAVRISRLPMPGDTGDSTAYLLEQDRQRKFTFVGDAVMAGASAPQSIAAALRQLEQAVGDDALLLPGHDQHNRFATTVRAEAASQSLPAGAQHGNLVDILPERLKALAAAGTPPVLVDVREGYEQKVGLVGAGDLNIEPVPLSSLLNALPRWLGGAREIPLVFLCRSGNRSAQAAHALRRLGYANAWSLAGGLALNAMPVHRPTPAQHA